MILLTVFNLDFADDTLNFLGAEYTGKSSKVAFDSFFFLEFLRFKINFTKSKMITLNINL